MQLLAFIICEEIKHHDTGHMDLIYAGGWKLPVPPEEVAGYQLQILIRFMPDPVEAGKRTLIMHYRDENGQDLSEPFSKTVDIRLDMINQYCINMDAVVSGPGRYSLDLFLDDQFVASHPLEIVE